MLAGEYVSSGNLEFRVAEQKAALPESLKASLQEHFKKVKIIHERDLAEGWGRVPQNNDDLYPCPQPRSVRRSKPGGRALKGRFYADPHNMPK
jgi:hypothetical protein